jgi:hypothetical protein
VAEEIASGYGGTNWVDTEASLDDLKTIKFSANHHLSKCDTV